MLHCLQRVTTCPYSGSKLFNHPKIEKHYDPSKQEPCMISGSCCDVKEIQHLLGFYTAKIGSLLAMFQDNPIDSIFKVQAVQKKCHTLGVQLHRKFLESGSLMFMQPFYLRTLHMQSTSFFPFPFCVPHDPLTLFTTAMFCKNQSPHTHHSLHNSAPNYSWHSSWTAWPLKGGRIGCLVMLVTNYQSTLRKTAEEHRSHQNYLPNKQHIILETLIFCFIVLFIYIYIHTHTHTHICLKKIPQLPLFLKHNVECVICTRTYYM